MEEILKQISSQQRKVYYVAKLKIMDMSRHVNGAGPKMTDNQIKTMTVEANNHYHMLEGVFAEHQCEYLYETVKILINNQQSLVALLVDKNAALQKQLHNQSSRTSVQMKRTSMLKPEQGAETIDLLAGSRRNKMGGVQLSHQNYVRYLEDHRILEQIQLEKEKRLHKKRMDILRESIFEELNHKTDVEKDPAKNDEITKYILETKRKNSVFNHVSYEQELNEILEFFQNSQNEANNFLLRRVSHVRENEHFSFADFQKDVMKTQHDMKKTVMDKALGFLNKFRNREGEIQQYLMERDAQVKQLQAKQEQRTSSAVQTTFNFAQYQKGTDQLIRDISNLHLTIETLKNQELRRNEKENSIVQEVMIKAKYIEKLKGQMIELQNEIQLLKKALRQEKSRKKIPTGTDVICKSLKSLVDVAPAEDNVSVEDQINNRIPGGPSERHLRQTGTNSYASTRYQRTLHATNGKAWLRPSNELTHLKFDEVNGKDGGANETKSNFKNLETGESRQTEGGKSVQFAKQPSNLETPPPERETSESKRAHPQPVLKRNSNKKAQKEARTSVQKGEKETRVSALKGQKQNRTSQQKGQKATRTSVPSVQKSKGKQLTRRGSKLSNRRPSEEGGYQSQLNKKIFKKEDTQLKKLKKVKTESRQSYEIPKEQTELPQITERQSSRKKIESQEYTNKMSSPRINRDGSSGHIVKRVRIEDYGVNESNKVSEVGENEECSLANTQARAQSGRRSHPNTHQAHTQTENVQQMEEKIQDIKPYLQFEQIFSLMINPNKQRRSHRVVSPRTSNKSNMSNKSLTNRQLHDGRGSTSLAQLPDLTSPTLQGTNIYASVSKENLTGEQRAIRMSKEHKQKLNRKNGAQKMGYEPIGQASKVDKSRAMNMLKDINTSDTTPENQAACQQLTEFKVKMMKSLKDSLIDEKNVQEIVQILNGVRYPSFKHESRHMKQSLKRDNRSSMSDLTNQKQETSRLDESVVVLKPMKNYENKDMNANSRVSQKELIMSKAKARNSLVQLPEGMLKTAELEAQLDRLIKCESLSSNFSAKFHNLHSQCRQGPICTHVLKYFSRVVKIIENKQIKQKTPMIMHVEKIGKTNAVEQQSQNLQTRRDSRLSPPAATNHSDSIYKNHSHKSSMTLKDSGMARSVLPGIETKKSLHLVKRGK